MTSGRLGLREERSTPIRGGDAGGRGGGGKMRGLLSTASSMTMKLEGKSPMRMEMGCCRGEMR